MLEYYVLFREFKQQRKEIGLLMYDTDKDRFSMSIDREAAGKPLPISLFGLSGDKLPDDRRIRNWIDARTIPEDRIGIESILAGLGLTEYDGWEILKAANGMNPGCDNWGFNRTHKPNEDWLKICNL